MPYISLFIHFFGISDIITTTTPINANVNKLGFDKVDNSGSGVSVIGSEVEENPDDYDV